MRAGLPFVLAALLLPGMTAGAQVAHPISALAPGDTIRLWSLQPRLRASEATVTAVARDTLAISVFPGMPDGLYRGPVAISHIQGLEVQRRRQSAPRLVGTALGGLLLGWVGGGMLGMAIECAGTSCHREFDGFGGALLGGAAGAIVGTGIGIKIGGRRVARWEPVMLKGAKR